MNEVFRLPGLVLTDHQLSVPLDHEQPDGDQILLFAREIGDPDGVDKPFLVFFQGGPGNEAPRPDPPPSGWLARALKDYRVLLLDQRGTGRSTPVGMLPNMTPAEQARYLTHFRADSIVRDAELLRQFLRVEQWSVLGQSFGGFCIMSYLSMAPEGLREAFVTGGLSPIGWHVDDVYQATFRRTLDRNRQFFELFPGDRERLDGILTELEDFDIRLPSGDRLTPRRFLQLGHMLGMSTGQARLHYILELPMDSPAFLRDVESALPFSRNPLYAVIHEACYADGCATNWSAGRVQPSGFQDERLFTGEHVFAWMFDDYASLSHLSEAAAILSREEWPRLYDDEVLRRNNVPAAAIIYLEDMYVDSDFSQETARTIKGMHAWVTNEYDHDGLRVDGERILGRLIDMVRGRV